MRNTRTSCNEALQTKHYLPYLMTIIPDKECGVLVSDEINTGFRCKPRHFDDRDFLEGLEEKGVEVIVIDWKQVSLEDCYKIASWAKFIIIRSCWNYVDDVESFCAKMEVFHHYGNLINPWQFGVSNTSKGMYLRQAASHGIPITPTIWLDRDMKPNWPEYFSKFGDTLFIKPMRGSGAKGCMKVTEHNIEEANALIAEYFAEGIGMMIQPCMRFKVPERKLIFIGRKRDQFSHAVTQTSLVATSLDKVIAYHPTLAELDLGYKVLEFVCKIAHIRPEDLPFLRVDIFVGEDGKLYVNEFSILEDQLYFRKALGSIERFVEVILRLIQIHPNEEKTQEQHTEPLTQRAMGILSILTAIVRIPFLLWRN